MSNRNIAEILVETGCYVNTAHSNEQPIVLPDGSSVPVYLSCRRLLSYPSERHLVATALSDAAEKYFPDANLVVGVATAGIGWAYAIASELGLPLAYVRSGLKEYGIQKTVDGDPVPGSRAIIVDDVLFSGKSVMHAVRSLMDEAKVSTEGVVSIAALNGGGAEAFSRVGNKAIALVGYHDLLNSAVEKGVINQEEKQAMHDYYEESGLGND